MERSVLVGVVCLDSELRRGFDFTIGIIASNQSERAVTYRLLIQLFTFCSPAGARFSNEYFGIRASKRNVTYRAFGPPPADLLGQLNMQNIVYQVGLVGGVGD